MSFDAYDFSAVARQQKPTRAELRWAEVCAAQLSDWIWHLGLAAAHAARFQWRAGSFVPTMQLRRTTR